MSTTDTPELEALFDSEFSKLHPEDVSTAGEVGLSQAAYLHQQWVALFEGQLSVDEFKHLAASTLDYLAEVAEING